MKPFSLLVKPASYGCNLRCRYCFYLCKRELFGADHMMRTEMLEKMISSFMQVKMPAYSFGWQGGEPTLMGLDFFRTAVSLQQRHALPGAIVSNGLQTNGTLLDDEWGKFLHEYNFLVGLSIDGPAEIHDINRVSGSGEGSHEKVLAGVDVLNRNQVEFNVLTLVTSTNIEKPELVYDYLKSLGVSFHQYVECVEFDNSGVLTEFSATPELWGEFLCRIFDKWYSKDIYDVSVRLFDSILAKLTDNVSNVCAIGTDCREYFVVEHNGNVYPCDFYVLPEYKLGNIMENSWQEMQDSELYATFGRRKRQWNEKCAECRHLFVCNGCCPKNRPSHGTDPSALSVLCKGWQMFFDHTMPRFRELSENIKARRRKELMQSQIPMGSPISKLGRNSPCPCGSGKKYKKCCGR